MAPILYKMVASPPSCSVKIVAELLGIELDCREVDFLKGEHRAPEYIKKNPMATIPMLEDGDFIVSESHAILRYLIAKRSTNKTLYPEDIETRAIVDQVSFFNAGVFFTRLDNAIYTMILDKTPPTANQTEALDKAYSTIEAYLLKHKYIAADHLTLADFSVGTTASLAKCLKPYYELDVKRFPRTADWLANLEKLPYFSKFSEPGIVELEKLIRL